MQMEAPPGSVSSRVQLSSLLSAVQTSLAELKVEVASARKLSREATACAESPRSVSQLVNPAAAISSPIPRICLLGYAYMHTTLARSAW